MLVRLSIKVKVPLHKFCDKYNLIRFVKNEQSSSFKKICTCFECSFKVAFNYKRKKSVNFSFHYFISNIKRIEKNIRYQTQFLFDIHFQMAKSKRSKRMRANRRALREKLVKKDEAKRLAAIKNNLLNRMFPIV